MTSSEMDTLRSDFAGLRADIDARIGGLHADIDARNAALRADIRHRCSVRQTCWRDIDARFDKLAVDLEVHLARLEAKIDEKPSTGVIYQAALAMFTGMFAVMVGTIVVLKALGMIH